MKLGTNGESDLIDDFQFMLKPSKDSEAFDQESAARRNSRVALLCDKVHN